MKTQPTTAVFTLIVLFSAVSVLSAASITWTAGPTTVTDEADIDLTGTLVHAGVWGGNNRTVDGILFVDRPIGGIANSDGYAVATASGEYSSGDCFNPAGTTVGADFEYVLDGFAYDGGNPKVVIISGLTIGQEYQVQLFTSDDRSAYGGRTQEWSDNATDGAGNETATFRHDASVFVIGTFTADAANQYIYGRGVNQSQNIVNAYVLRAIPEPGTILILAAGLAVCGLRGRRKRIVR